MTKVERIYEIDKMFKEFPIKYDLTKASDAQKVLKIGMGLIPEKQSLLESLPFCIEIKGLEKKLNIETWEISPYVLNDYKKKDDNNYRARVVSCYLKSDNLIELIEYIIKNNALDSISNIYGYGNYDIRRLTKLIIDNFSYIKSHEYSNQLITLLSTDDERNIELVITMLGLVEPTELTRYSFITNLNR